MYVPLSFLKGGEIQLKKLISCAVALCFVFTSASAFAEMHHDGGAKTHKHHKTTKVKSVTHKKGKTVKIREVSPGMPKTGMGGTSND